MKRIRRAYELFSELTATEVERAGKHGHIVIQSEPRPYVDLSDPENVRALREKIIEDLREEDKRAQGYEKN